MQHGNPQELTVAEDALRSGWSPLIQRAAVLRAPLLKTESGRSLSPFRVVSIKDFPPAGYLEEPERTIYLRERIPQARKYALQPYDVLVTIVGTIGEVTILPPECPTNWIPATNMFVVRMDNDPDGSKARTFYGLMKSSFGQDILESLAHGARIQIVSKKRFSRTAFPPFTNETIAIFEELWQQEKDLYAKSRELLRQASRLYLQAPDIESVVA